MHDAVGIIRVSGAYRVRATTLQWNAVKDFWTTLLDGLRAVFLRRPRNGSLTVGAGVFIALIGVYGAIAFGIALVDTPRPWQFNAFAVSALLADPLLALVAGWVLVAFAQRRAIAWGSAAIVLAAMAMNALVIRWPLAHASDILLGQGHALAAVVLQLLPHLWWLLVLLGISQWLNPHRMARALSAAILAYAVTIGTWWLPQASLLSTSGTPIADVGVDEGDEPVAEEAPATFDAEQVMFEQPALLDAALAQLKPQTPGKVDLYVVAFAGDGGEDVFRNEAEYADKLFAQRFDADGHVLVLENNAATVATRPLATWTNLHHALEGIAGKMDPAEDMVLLYLTTHGSEDHQLLVDLDPLPLDQIEPVDLLDAFKTSPSMRWKVIIVNACYSGGFVDTLRDDSTLVMTSARADRTSFGCGATSDITYFGRAFLVDALNRTTSLRDAFELARQSVAQWESADKEQASYPQIATAPGIEAKLAQWQKQLRPQPAVPFMPAAPSSIRDE